MIRLEHGEHNYKVCNSLHLQEEIICTDWVVTTAFYSAVHFIEHKLFPCPHNGKIFKNVNEAHLSLGQNSKHQTRAYLVNKYLSELKGDYTYLEAQSHSARYTNYDVNERIAELSVKKLEKIAEYCK